MTLTSAIVRAMWQMAGHRGLDTEEMRVRVGVTEPYWRALLTFNADMHVSLVEKMAEALGVTPGQLVAAAEELMAEDRRARKPIEQAVLRAMLMRASGPSDRVEGEGLRVGETKILDLYMPAPHERMLQAAKDVMAEGHGHADRGPFERVEGEGLGVAEPWIEAARRTGLYQRVLPDREEFRASESILCISTPNGGGLGGYVKRHFLAMNECDPRIAEMMQSAAEPWSTAMGPSGRVEGEGLRVEEGDNVGLDGLWEAVLLIALVLAIVMMAALVIMAAAVVYKQFWIVALFVGFVIGFIAGRDR